MEGSLVSSLPHAPSLHISPSLPAFPKVSKFSPGCPLQSSSASLFIDSLQKSSTNHRRIRLRTSIACSYGRDFVNEAPAKVLRRILDSPGVHQGPACFDALSAELVERAGFQYCFTSGMQFLENKGFLYYYHFRVKSIFPGENRICCILSSGIDCIILVMSCACY